MVILICWEDSRWCCVDKVFGNIFFFSVVGDGMAKLHMWFG